MTVVSYPLGHPLPASLRGGDCWGHDLRPDPISGEAHPITERPHVHGAGHVFRSPEHCAIQNGLLRLFVNAGSPPSLTMQMRQGRLVVDDYYEDTYVDLYGGAYSVPEWIDAAAVVTIDSPDVAAVLTGVRLVEVNPEKVTIRLVAPLIGDAFVTLHRGWRAVRIQHGDNRATVPVSVARRVSMTGTPVPVGTAALGRVEESTAGIGGMFRFVASIDSVTANAGAFSVASGAVESADFGAGVGTDSVRDRPLDLHRQLGNASRPLHLVREVV